VGKIFLTIRDHARLRRLVRWFEGNRDFTPPRRPPVLDNSGSEMKLWRVTSLAPTGYFAYYTCVECNFDATYFGTSNTNPIVAGDDAVVVFNIAEAGEASTSALSVGDYLQGHATIDDEGNFINYGAPVSIAGTFPNAITKWRYNVSGGEGGTHKFQIQTVNNPAWADVTEGGQPESMSTVIDCSVNVGNKQLLQQKRTAIYVLEDGDAGAATSYHTGDSC